MLSRILPVILCLFFVPISNAKAAIDLPAVIGNHAVLQMQAEVPIWGSADPKTEITVTFADQTVTAITDESGNWQATLMPMASSAVGRKMVIAGGGQRIVLNDILVGVVWLCGGQSNMEWTVRQSMNAKEEMAAGDLPWLRCIKEFEVVGRVRAIIIFKSASHEGGGSLTDNFCIKYRLHVWVHPAAVPGYCFNRVGNIASTIFWAS